jgi:hypothetical protein
MDTRLMGAIMMNALKRMLGRQQGGKSQAWSYFGIMQKADAANDRHYTKMLQACRSIAEIDELMEDFDRSSTRPTAAIYTTLHKVYVQLGLFDEAARVLKTAKHEGLLDISDADRDKPFSIRILDSSTLSAIATNTLRSLCDSGPDGRQDAEAYFEAVSGVGFSCAVHYSVMLESCDDMEEVARWMEHMDQKKVQRDEHIYTILQKVMTRLGEFHGAAECLAEALRSEQITEEAAGASITSSLSELIRVGETANAWAFFRALRRYRSHTGGAPPLVSHYQFNLMLSLCPTLYDVRNLVGEMEADDIAWDAITYTTLHAALVRCGEPSEAIAVLRRGCDCGLVDADTRSIAATSALKYITEGQTKATVPPRQRPQQRTQQQRAAQARDYVSLLQRAGLVDNFQYCYLLRHCIHGDPLALQSIVDELESARVPKNFHLCAALHRAYVRFPHEMADKIEPALKRLQASFMRMHDSREATIDEVRIRSEHT